MRYIFIVQGEGRGHLTQAMAVERLLRENGHEVIAVLVGKSPSRKLPDFFTNAIKAPIETFDSINFVPASNNRKPSLIKTAQYIITHNPAFFSSTSFIKRKLKTLKPDVVINFYDSLGTFGYWRSGIKAPLVCIGAQFIYTHKDFKLPIPGYEEAHAMNMLTRIIRLKAAKVLALSFRSMQDDTKHNIKVVPPLLRPEVLALRNADGTGDPSVKDGGYIHGYMLNTGFADEVIRWHEKHPDVKMHFFWDNEKEAPVKVIDENLVFYYLDDKEFLRQMASCHAYASTAGFDSICEAMYLGKPILMVPSHIEQKCNAFNATRGFIFNPQADHSIRPCVSSDVFDLDKLLDFVDNEFVPDSAFPAWAHSAHDVFLKELTTF